MEVKSMALADVVTPQLNGAFMFIDTTDNNLLKIVRNIAGARDVKTVTIA